MVKTVQIGDIIKSRRNGRISWLVAGIKNKSLILTSKNNGKKCSHLLDIDYFKSHWEIVKINKMKGGKNINGRITK